MAVSYLNVRCSRVWLEEARKVVVESRLLYFEEVRTRHFRMLSRMTITIPCFQCEGKIRGNLGKNIIDLGTFLLI